MVSHEQKEAWGMETGDIGAVLMFYFAQTEEVTGRERTEMAEELLSELRRFASGDLPREELETLSARIVSNTPAIESLAREIKLRWDRDRVSS
jgi:hypothetical protein